MIRFFCFTCQKFRRVRTTKRLVAIDRQLEIYECARHHGPILGRQRVKRVNSRAKAVVVQQPKRARF